MHTLGKETCTAQRMVSPSLLKKTAAWEECFEVARTYCTILVEVHLGLKTEEERQLFHDLNQLGKRVDANLALQFDNSNPINLFIKEVLISKLNLRVTEFEIKNWSEDDGAVSRKDLVAVNALLFLNKTNISGATPALMEGKSTIAHQFWTAVMAIPGLRGAECARTHSRGSIGSAESIS